MFGSKSGSAEGVIVFLIIFALFMVILMPHALIWAVNCLVASGGVGWFEIGHTLKDWFCAFVVMAAFSGGARSLD